jgi:hypothetical protein
VRGLISTAIAIGIGCIVLLGYLIPLQIFIGVRMVILQWAIILMGCAVLVGFLNLFLVHLEKIRKRQKGMFYSLILLFFMLMTFALGMAFGPENPMSMFFFNSIQVPVESSLMALLAVTLIYASIRLLRWRTDFMAVVFLVTALLILAGMTPVPFLGAGPILSDLIRPAAELPALAGARGILIGVALGTLTTGLRVLLGADRPYGGK